MESPADSLADAQLRADLQSTVSTVLVTATSMEQAVPSLLNALATTLLWDYAAMWCVEDGRLRCLETWTSADSTVVTFANSSREMAFTRGRGLPGRCWDTQEPVWLSAVQPDPELPRVAFARKANLKGGLAFPVTNGSGVVGVIEGFTRSVETISPELLRLVKGIGEQVGQFMQRQATEQRLRTNEARYSAIVNRALDAIVAIDASGHITEFNKAAEDLFGHTRADVLGMEMASVIVPPGLRESHRAGLRRVQQTGEGRVLDQRLELTAMRRDSSEFPVELTITRLGSEPSAGFIGFMRDITERQRYTSEREALLAREQQAFRDAAAANRLKDEFLAALSHELRTPLNAIMGWAQMLEQGTVSAEKVKDAIASIRRNAQVQHQLVNDMLDLSAFIAGRMHFDTDRMPLRVPLDAAVETVQPAVTSKRLSLVTSVPDVEVVGDPVRLQQVFWNLLGNAVKFTAARGHVEVSGHIVDDEVVIEVRDDGIGIDPAFVPFVFDRFRQGAPPGAGGLGLGLAIVRQIVEAHGGTVAAHSDGAGTGASFTVRLPIAPQS